MLKEWIPAEMPEEEELKKRLKEGESVIRRKFQAEKVWKLTSKSTIIDAASAS